jgi:hypothetical protein
MINFEISAVKIKENLSMIRTVNECIWSIAFPPYTTASMSDTVLIPSGNALHYVSVVYITTPALDFNKMHRFSRCLRAGIIIILSAVYFHSEIIYDKFSKCRF